MLEDKNDRCGEMEPKDLCELLSPLPTFQAMLGAEKVYSSEVGPVLPVVPQVILLPGEEVFRAAVES